MNKVPRTGGVLSHPSTTTRDKQRRTVPDAGVGDCQWLPSLPPARPAVLDNEQGVDSDDSDGGDVHSFGAHTQTIKLLQVGE